MATFLSRESRVFSDRSPCLQVYASSLLLSINRAFDCGTGCAVVLVVMFGNSFGLLTIVKLVC